MCHQPHQRGHAHHQPVADHHPAAPAVVVQRRQAGHAVRGQPGRRREHLHQAGAGPAVVVVHGVRRGGRPAAGRLPDHGDDLRAGDEGGGPGAHGGEPQPVPPVRLRHPARPRPRVRLGHLARLGQPGRPGQQARAVLRARRIRGVRAARPGWAHEPGDQDHDREDPRQHRRFLVGQQGRAEDRAKDDRLAAARRAAQADRRRQGQRQEQRAEGQVQLVPAAPGEVGRQAEEGAGGDRPEAGGQPQPGCPVHGVAQQARAGDGQQVVGHARPEGERDRGHQHTRQGHQGVVGELGADRGREVAGRPRVAEMGELTGDPPEAPDVGGGVAGRGQRAGQVGSPGPGDGDPQGQVAGEQPQLPGHRGPGRACAGQ